MELSSGYKQTDIGRIPEDWEVVAASNVAAPVRNAIVGGPFGSDLISTDYVEFGIPVIRGQNLGSRIVSGDFAFVTEEKAQSLESNLARGNDLIFTQRGTLGQVSLIAPGDFERYLVSQSQMKLTIDRTVADPTFYYYVFSSAAQQEFIRKNTIQTGVPHINLGILRKIPVPVPSLEEQKAIAKALSDVDELIESLEQIIAKKRFIKQGVMQELLSGRKRLHGFIGSWKEKRLGELFQISGGVSASRDQLGLEGHCYLHYGDIHATTKTVVNIPLEFPVLPKLNTPLSSISSGSLLKDGDVVFVDASEDIEGASRHIVVINPDDVPFISGLHTIVAKGKTDELDCAYRRYCFQTVAIREQFQFYVVGTKVSGISKANLRKIKLPTPSLVEQKAIASILSDMDNVLESIEAKLAKVRRVKVGMMQQLLTGSIRLVQSSSNVIVFPKSKNAASAKKSHSSEFEDAVIIGVLANYFGTETWPLSRFKYTKLSYLLRRRELKTVNTYLKKAAGPYNPRTRYGGPERITLQKGYSRNHSNGKYSGFVAGENVDEAERYFESWFGKEALEWLTQFRFEKHEQLELLTTVDMAVVELQKENKIVGVEQVKQLICNSPEWAPKLDRSVFSDINIKLAIDRSRLLFGENKV